MLTRMFKFLILLQLFNSNSVALGQNKLTSQIISVLFDAKIAKFAIEEGTLPNRVAWANFTDEIDKTGWSFLNIVTNETFPDEIQAYAAGFAEGHLTAQLLKNHFMNILDGLCDNEDDPKFCDKLWNFLNKNMEWMKKNIKNHKYDPHWHQIHLILKQLQGLQDGCHVDIISDARHQVLKDFGFLLFNVFYDAEDLRNVLGSKYQQHVKLGSCSVLIKLLPENSDLYVSHDTWFSYSTMTRCLKRYEFYYHISEISGSQLVPGRTMAFSSYPGALQSMDDFYIIANTELVVVETSLANFNEELWKLVKPESLLTFFRCIYANRMAEDGQSWAAAIALNNSGTYNNQWMIVDFKKFEPHHETLDGLLWIVDQLPGQTISADVSNVLKQQSYWASYNLPYFPSISELSGTKNKSERVGDFDAYANAPRAQIFKRDHHNVVDLESMSKLMRSNYYQNDPLSTCKCDPPHNAMNAIAGRGDLNPTNGTYEVPYQKSNAYGATDMKLTNYQMMSSLQFLAYSGPTAEQQQPFQWSKYSDAAKYPHFGQPDLWNFSTILVSWK